MSKNTLEITQLRSQVAARIRSMCKCHPQTGKKTTYAALARYLGIKQQSVSQWGRGNMTPDPKFIISISDFFGVSCDYLLGRSETPTFTAAAPPAKSDTGLSTPENRLVSNCINSFIDGLIDSLELYREELEERGSDLPLTKIPQAVKRDLRHMPNERDVAAPNADTSVQPEYVPDETLERDMTDAGVDIETPDVTPLE